MATKTHTKTVTCRIKGKEVEADLGTLAAEVERRKALGKKHYQASDDLLDQLLAVAPCGTVLTKPNGKKVKVIDNFAEKNKVFRPAGVRRFDLKEVK